MREDLLQAIAKEKEITNAIVLTHNIDFVFLQSVVLSALRRCGQPTLTVFADAGCAIESFARQSRLLDGLGMRYRVVPVAMESGFRFHPKALLLSGSSSATLYVGSGNLTFGGWRENAEVWMRFQSQTDGTSVLAAFEQYLRGVLARVPLADSVQAEVDEAFDPNTRQWASGMDHPSGLIGKVGEGGPLLERMLAQVAGAPFDCLTVCAPYFDDDGDALFELVRAVGATTTNVVIQPGRSGLTRKGWARLSASSTLAPVTFRREQSERDPFLHAKLYALERGGRVIVFAGSANCSRAALTIPGSQGNAELLAIREVSLDEFQGWLMSELTVLSEPPQLIEKAIFTDSDDGEAQLRILAARHEVGQLRIAFSPKEAAITSCSVDDSPISFESISPGILKVPVGTLPRTVQLGGLLGGTKVLSALGWVDHEHQLRATARARHLVDAIRGGVRPENWNVGAWADLLGVFCKHLSYLPSRFGIGGAQESTSKATGEKRHEFTYQDVFSTKYGLPSLHLGSLPSADSRVHSLQQLLLRWFGVPLSAAEDTGTKPPQQESDDDEMVDRPESMPPVVKPPIPATVSDRDKRRTKKAVTELAHIITDPDFLSKRPPELLGCDLGLASALLRSGVNDEWLDQNTFFEATHRIWSTLFLASEMQPSVGWIEQQYHSFQSPHEFANKLRSPQLAAALAAWTFAVPKVAPGPDYSRFALSSCLAVARLPWLWDDLELDAVARELAAIVISTSAKNEAMDSTLQRVRQHWQHVIRRGHALRRLENALSGHQPAELSAKIHQQGLQAGELLWQGKSGFCVALENCDRKPSSKVNVLRLQGKAEKGKYLASQTIPLRALVEKPILAPDQFGKDPRAALSAWLTDIGLSAVITKPRP